uniref:Uncharacterized protein n=1 Tax=viral metagenome TaxID=1070528 RepID=A0A6C0K458_9ZZZZ
MKDIIFYNIFSEQDLQKDLFEAIKSGNIKDVRSVLDRIKQSGRASLIVEPRNGTITPLVFAILQGNPPEIIQLLLDHGASSDINTPLRAINNNTPLHMAVQSQPINIEVIRLLLENGAFASIHKKNAQGKTPMDINPTLPWKLAIIAESLYKSTTRERIQRQQRQARYSETLEAIDRIKEEKEKLETALLKQREMREKRQAQLMKQKQRCKKKYPVLSVKDSVSRPESELDEYLRMNYPEAFMKRLGTIQNRTLPITTLEDLFWGSSSTTTTLLPEHLYLFHGTDAFSRRSLQNRGLRTNVASRTLHGMGFYTTPSPEEAVQYAFSKYTENRRNSIAPTLLILRISREKARGWVYPQDFNFRREFPYYVILKNQEKVNSDIEQVETLFLETL